MKRPLELRRVWPLMLLFTAMGIGAQEEPAFDASQFEKKPFELGGYVQLKQESFSLNRSAAFYKLGFYNQPQRESLDRTTGTLQVAGKARQGIGTFDFRLNADVQRDQLASDHGGKVFEATYSIRPSPGFTLEAGKRSLKWGKGYAWNPIGFVERPKDPNDPQLAREGFVMANADWISSPGGDLQTVAFTPVLVPVSGDVNRDFGEHGHLNPAAKLYLLYRDTDIDFAWQGKGSRPARFGMDFSRNLVSNFEIHGEWARIREFPRPVTDNTGRVTTEVANATSYLLGARYLTASDTTYIAEYYRNGTGYSEDESRQFYRLVESAFTTGNNALVQRALSLAQGSYGRPNAGKDYVYLRAQQKDALDIVYFAAAITAIVNLQDRSYQLTPELQYTGIKNLELRARLLLLHGGRETDFGEKQVSRKLELYARYYF
ncbi:MAG: hypothetical protein A3G81_13595 [Betaproteobacteria bacterium RIFCSPLOWO2_12_FULL_65_14]|nr:MAG: hypothetical protein A3G81_13595 [Betaproteobacteria bacterium RIFCSPLOWO2_12_FULL_65_14]